MRRPSVGSRWPASCCSSWPWLAALAVDKAVGHPGHGRLGVLAGHGRQLPGARAWASGGSARRRRAPSAASSPGSGICLFYLVTTRYFPRHGRQLLRHDVAAQPGDRQRRWSTSPRHGADRMPWTAGRRWRNPLANKVGWFDLNNINCGLLGMPLGFLVIYVVSLMTKAPSAEMQAFVDEIRKPRGQTVLEEKTSDRHAVRASERGPSGPRFFLPACQVPLRCRHCAGRRSDGRRCTMGGYLLTLLVLSPAELRSGGADVHAARPRAAQPVRRRRTSPTTSGASSAASPIRSSRSSRW